MAQDKKQIPSDKNKVKSDTSSLQGNEKATNLPQKDTIDLASINASAVDESGEFMRRG